MPIFTQADIVFSGTQGASPWSLTGSAFNDQILIDNSYIASSTFAGVIDGGAGFNQLFLSGSRLVNVSFLNIDRTTLASTGEAWVDAGQVSALGRLSLDPAIGGTGSLALFETPGQPAIFDLFLRDGEILQVRASGGSGTSYSVDFGGGTYLGDAHIEYSGSFGSDSVLGSSGDDTLDGGYGDDILIGGAGNDLLIGSRGINTLLGGDGDDILTADVFGGGSIDGGNGDDEVRLQWTFENSTIDGGAGYDTLSISRSPAPTLVLAGFEKTLLNTTGVQVTDAQLAQLGEIENNTASMALYISVREPDGIPASVDVNLKDGETIQIDTFGGAPGEQLQLDFSGGTFAGNASMTFYGSDADESILAGSGDDTLFASPGMDSLLGGAGNDTFELGSPGVGSYFDGGAGNDTFDLQFGELTGGTISGGGGDDTLHLGGRLLSSVVTGIEQTVFYSGGTIGSEMFGSLGTVTFDPLISSRIELRIGDPAATTALLDWTIPDGKYLELDLEGEMPGDYIVVDLRAAQFEGSSYAVFNGFSYDVTLELYGTTGDDRLHGANLADTLIGGSGADELYGEQGDDSIEGGFDADQIYGHDGADTLAGGAGSDHIDGGWGGDHIRGGNGADSLLGDEGDDWINGEGFTDSIAGGNGDDTLFGGGGSDTITGDEGNDSLYGNNGNDFLSESSDFSGMNYLDGGQGNDSLRGGNGSDTLVGSTGNDVMEGGFNFGSGSDVFLFRANHGTFDRITDFVPGTDIIRFDINAINDFGDLTITNPATGAKVDYGSGSFRLLGVDASALGAGDFEFV